jgi:non-ribosomal peptide synthase protein (TIGR01720 family)
MPGRLLQVIDHLVVDAYSEPIILQDLETAYRQLVAGEALQLPGKTTSFKYWAERLAAYERSKDLADEREYWQSIVHEPVRPLPADYAIDSAQKGLRREVVARLSPEETSAVLHAVPRATGAQIDHILLTAIVEAVSDWTGQRVVRIDLRNHGRQPLFDDVDVSRTVGWFTSSFPVLLDKPPGAQIEGTLRSVRNRLRETPSHGMGYQMLAGAIEGERAAGAGRTQIILNYQGQVDRLYGDLEFLAPRPRTTKPEEGRLTRPDPAVQITARVQNGELSLQFVYHERVYRSESIGALGDGICAALGVLAATCGQG